jgi:XRE family transcriptional regulator, regulator of sulfur utilization
MLVRKLRLQRGWSQEHLAELVGVSVRTIQRIERGYSPGLETSKALASVFEVDVSTFTSEESKVNKNENLSESTAVADDEKEAMLYVKGIKEFYDHLIIYFVFVVVFGFAFYDPFNKLFGVILGFDNFLVLGFLGWGVGVIVHGLSAFEIIRWPGLGAGWEKRAVEKRLGRKL